MHNKIKKFLSYCYIIYQRFNEDHLTASASALTFTTLLSLVPLISVCLTILSYLPLFKNVNNQLRQLIFENFVPSSSEIIYQYLLNFVEQTAKLSLLGFIFLVITCVLTLFTIESAFDRIWKVQERRQKISSWLYYLLILCAAPIFIGISATASYYVLTLKLVNSTASLLGIGHFLLRFIPMLVSFIAFSLLYIVLPNCKVPIKHALGGALVAAILIEIIKRCFIYYLDNYATYELIYGTLAVIPIFLMWLYVLWIIVLLGALVANVLSSQQSSHLHK